MKTFSVWTAQRLSWWVRQQRRVQFRQNPYIHHSLLNNTCLSAEQQWEKPYRLKVDGVVCLGLESFSDLFKQGCILKKARGYSKIEIILLNGKTHFSFTF